MRADWYVRCYRRNLIDMHISDWDARFMAQADARALSATLALDQSGAIHVFANSHTGLTYYPSAVGRMHAGLQGRDLLGEQIACYHALGKAVSVYYSVVYNEWFWETYPDSRVLDADGHSERLLVGIPAPTRRSSVCCPNHAGYRAFVVTQLRELGARYAFESFYPDNCFWPTVCYCPACRARYAAELGGEMPRVIRWDDPTWVRFQRQRQAWIAEFARLISDTVRAARPGVTVSHQANIWNGDWLLGPSLEMVAATDWLAADAGGDRAELSYVAKLFHSLSAKKPFEMIHSWNHRAILEHTAAWTEERLRCAAFAAFIHGGARTFIDGIDPVGTLNPDNHRRAGRVFREIAAYEPYAGGDYGQDIGIYVSFDAFISLNENGRDVTAMRYNFDPTRPAPEPETHRHAAIGMTRALMQDHLPFGIVTARDLGRLDAYQVIVLPNVVMLHAEEAEALRAYVRRGGSLYVSKHTGLLRADGVREGGDSMLADVLGIRTLGETHDNITYAAPCAGARDAFQPFSAAYPVQTFGSMAHVAAQPGAEVLATITLPYCDPRGERYASIFSNPPGVVTDWPALVRHRYGQGQTLYAAGVFELWDYETQRAVLCRLIRSLCTRPLCLEAQAPKPVEVTLFDQPHEGRLLVHLLNFQSELPNIPVDGIALRIRLDGRTPRRLVRVPDGASVAYAVRDGIVECVAPRLETYAMLMLEYDPAPAV